MLIIVKYTNDAMCNSLYLQSLIYSTVAPKFVFFDSNTWIYLANGFDVFANKYLELHFKVFEILEKRVLSGDLVIFTNGIIKEEWARHQDDAAIQIKNIINKANHYKDQLRDIGRFTAGNEQYIEHLIKSVDEETQRKVALHEAHIEKVKKFIEDRTEAIAVSDQHRIEASQMAQRKQAPFIGDKSNSMSDALILLSITDFLDTSKKNDNPAVRFALAEAGWVESYFITSNFNDFAALPDKHSIHPDLAPILARSGTFYYPSLGPLINKLEKEFLTQDELRAIEEADRSTFCQVCDSDYPTVQFCAPTSVFDPFKFNGHVDPSQLELFEKGAEVVREEPFSDVESAFCDHCGADYIICPNCYDMVHLKQNEKTACTGCEYNFIVKVTRDRKGAIHGYEYEIVRNFLCIDCGDSFEEVDHSGCCETCAEYRDLATS